MNISFKPLDKPTSGAFSVFLMDESLSIPKVLQDIDKENHILQLIKSKNFDAKLNSLLCISLPIKNELHHICLVGIGKSPKKEDILVIGGKLCNRLNKKHITHANIYLDSNLDNTVEFCVELCTAIKLMNYSFNKYFNKKSEEHKLYLNSVEIYLSNPKEAEKQYNNIADVLESTLYTRDLVSEPSNVLFPESFTQECKKLEAFGIKVKILDEAAMRKEGMEALLSVGKGSDHKPYCVVMEWHGDSTKPITEKPLTFVGKGVTFDSGGINLKTNSSISEMKYDMAGAGTVTGLMRALAKRKAKVNAIGAIGLVENMPSSRSMKPSDVISSMSKQTIEVDDTDAEGRLVLSDVLWYVQTHYKPKFIVDLATLTGSIVIALGSRYAGLFSNDEKFASQLIEAGNTSGDLLWRMPLAKYYDKQIDSDIADVKNTGNKGREGGSITAAQFLQRFIKDNTTWAHIDIAGVAWTSTATDVCSKGATGFGVRLLNQLIVDNFEG